MILTSLFWPSLEVGTDAEWLSYVVMVFGYSHVIPLLMVVLYLVVGTGVPMFSNLDRRLMAVIEHWVSNTTILIFTVAVLAYFGYIITVLFMKDVESSQGFRVIGALILLELVWFQ